jgi:CRP-like cAMP-binding protein
MNAVSDSDNAAGLPAGLFPGVSARARSILETGSAVRRYSEGQALWLAGSTPTGIHVILEGSVRIVRGDGGRQHVVHAEGAGATIGEVPLFDGGPYPATALARTRVRSLFVPRDVLLAAMAADPRLALTLLRGLSRRIRILVDGLSSATLRTVRSRLAHHLLDRADSGSRSVVTLGGTHAEVAETLGTVREVVTREMARLRRAGVVRSTGRRGIEIVDRTGLEAIAAGNE